LFFCFLHDEDTPVFKTSTVHGNIFGTWNLGPTTEADAARIPGIREDSQRSRVYRRTGYRLAPPLAS